MLINELIAITYKLLAKNILSNCNPYMVPRIVGFTSMVARPVIDCFFCFVFQFNTIFKERNKALKLKKKKERHKLITYNYLSQQNMIKTTNTAYTVYMQNNRKQKYIQEANLFNFIILIRNSLIFCHQFFMFS